MQFTPIIKRALTETVVSIGQLTHAEQLELNRAVRHGILDKGKGGPFPAIKTVYACHGFDFVADREHYYREFCMWHALDVARGVVSQ